MTNFHKKYFSFIVDAFVTNIVIKQHLRLFFVFALFMPCYITAAERVVRLNIGGRILNVSSPNGFVEISHISPKTMNVLKGFISPNNKLIAAFISENDLAQILKDENLWEVQKAILLQVNNSTENSDITKEQFTQVRSAFKSEFDELFKKYKNFSENFFNNGISNFSKDSINLKSIKPGEQVPLGIFLNNENVIGFSVMSKFEKINKFNQYYEDIVVASSIMLRINERIIILTAMSTYGDKKDLEWVRTISVDCANQIINSSPTIEKSSDSSKKSNKSIDNSIGRILVFSLFAVLASIAVGIVKLSKRFMHRKAKENK